MRQKAKLSLLSPEALRSLISAGGPFELLDVRTDGERRNLPFFEARPLEPEVELELEKLAHDRPLVFICYRGVRSRTAAQRFVDLGFHHVFSLEGGLEAYVKKFGRPVATPVALSA